MATPQATQVADPTIIAFVERLIDKGMYPLLIAFGIWWLVARYGWPWKQVGEPPPPPSQNKEVAEALHGIGEEFKEFRLEVVQRLTAVETELKLRRRKPGDQ